MTLGQKLKKLRTEKGLTQKELSDQLHITFQTVSKWESDINEPDIASLKHLVEILECSLDDLLNVEVKSKVEDDSDAGFIVSSNATNASNSTAKGNLLTTCPACKKEVSINAEVCPNCGQRLLTRPQSAPHKIVYHYDRASNIIEREHNMKHIGGIIGGIFGIILSLGLFIFSLWALQYSKTEGTIGIVSSILVALACVGLIIWCKYRLDTY